jgi:hypothetical protein
MNGRSKEELKAIWQEQTKHERLPSAYHLLLLISLPSRLVSLADLPFVVTPNFHFNAQ